MKLSIIVPCYNVERFVERAVGSCKIKSCNCALEIICVDDCSTDGTLSRIEKLAEQNEYVRVVRHQVNKKLLSARRSGVAVATGDYIVHLDADDQFVDGALDAIVNKLQQAPVDVLFFGSAPVVFDMSKKGDEEIRQRVKLLNKVLIPPRKCDSKDVMLNSLFITRNFATTVWGKVWRTDIVRKCMDIIPEGPLMLAEDAVQCIISMKYANTVSTLDIVGYLYTIDVGVTVNEVFCQRGIKQRFDDLFGILCAMKEFRRHIDNGDAYLKYLRAFEYSVCRDFGIFCRPYLNSYMGCGDYGSINNEHIDIVAMWYGDNSSDLGTAGSPPGAFPGSGTGHGTHRHPPPEQRHNTAGSGAHGTAR